MKKFQKILGLAVLALACLSPSGGWSGQLELGAQYQGWDMNLPFTVPGGGYEFWYPLSLSFEVAPQWGFYTQAKLGNGNYTPSLENIDGAIALTDFTDTVVGSQLGLKLFGIPAAFGVELNLGTGDTTWEEKEVLASPPTDLIDSRYQGRGFGAEASFALSFPEGASALQTSVEYFYSSAFNPAYASFNFPILQLGDAVEADLNRVEKFDGGKNSVIRLSGLFSFPTYQADVADFEMGPDFNFSYAFNNPNGFSYQLGGEFFMPSAVLGTDGNLAAEIHNRFGPRFYEASSMAFGDFALAERVKFVAPNDYPSDDPGDNYDGGGWDFGLEPSWGVSLGGGMSLKFTASYDYLVAQSFIGIVREVDYHRVTLASYYDLKI